ncbi:MAG: NAD-dependent protein deacylase, partial [Xanthomonadales bacterium]|nr:NAD-dependent protein deacylase [Xanthomonadales bacterium]
MIDKTAPLLDKHLLQRLGEAQHVTVLSGAGMSAESGIPTFRDAQTGIWAKYRAEDLATPEAFAANPARVWRWYEERRNAVRSARPHAGHQALVMLESLVPALSLLTQNVDGLHQLAGSNQVIELHGNILRSKCHITG